MFVALPPYLHAHLFFHKFQQTKIGVACNINWWPEFRGLTAHHCLSLACIDGCSISSPALAAKKLHTLLANWPELNICSMLSIPALSMQQKQCDGSMPMLVNFSLVGSLRFMALHKRKDDLKGIELCHKRLKNLFLGFLLLISSHAEWQLNLPWLSNLQTAWSGFCCCEGIAVAMILVKWVVGACSSNFLQFQLPFSQKSATLLLLNLMFLLVCWASDPVPNQLSHQKEQFPELSCHCMYCSPCCLVANMCFQAMDSPVSHFLLTGLDLWQYLAFRKSPHKVCLVRNVHHCLNWKDLQMSCRFLIPIPPSSYG